MTLALPPHSRISRPTRSLLEGGSYTPAANTNIRKRFEEMAAKPANVKPLRKAGAQR